MLPSRETESKVELRYYLTNVLFEYNGSGPNFKRYYQGNYKIVKTVHGNLNSEKLELLQLISKPISRAAPLSEHA